MAERKSIDILIQLLLCFGQGIIESEYIGAISGDKKVTSIRFALFEPLGEEWVSSAVRRRPDSHLPSGFRLWSSFIGLLVTGY